MKELLERQESKRIWDGKRQISKDLLQGPAPAHACVLGFFLLSLLPSSTSLCSSSNPFSPLIYNKRSNKHMYVASSECFGSEYL